MTNERKSVSTISGAKLLATAGVGVIAGLATSDSAAEIIYVDDSPVSLNIFAPFGSTASWDVDGNGMTEMEIKIRGFSTSNFETRYISLVSQDLYGNQLNGRGFVENTDDIGEFINHNPGELISAVLPNYGTNFRTWGQTNAYRRPVMYYFNTGATSSPEVNVYGRYFNQFDPSYHIDPIFGFRFDIDGAIHYGWGELQIYDSTTGDPGTVLISRWAYESDAGVGILAGDIGQAIPEPNSLWVLAMGAAGLLAYRRNKTGCNVSAS